MDLAFMVEDTMAFQAHEAVSPQNYTGVLAVEIGYCSILHPYSGIPCLLHLHRILDLVKEKGFYQLACNQP